MSRIANYPIPIPSGVEVKIEGRDLSVKGSKGSLEMAFHSLVELTQEDTILKVGARKDTRQANALAGTTRALVNNMVIGVNSGFKKGLKLVGVGYRAQVKGEVLNLNLGYSHPIDFPIPDGITIETPSPTDVVVSGINKQQVGQVAANIRGLRPPEPYKGKGVRYTDETVRLKEAKKK